MDPEEALESIRKGFKNVIKKTTKIVNNIEDKCKNFLNKQQVENKEQPLPNTTNQDILFFEGGDLIQEEIPNHNKPKVFSDDSEINYLKFQKQENIPNYFLDQNKQMNEKNDTPFLDEYLKDNIHLVNQQNQKKIESDDPFQQFIFNKNTNIIEQNDFLNFEDSQKISTPFD